MGTIVEPPCQLLYFDFRRLKQIGIKSSHGASRVNTNPRQSKTHQGPKARQKHATQALFLEHVHKHYMEVHRRHALCHSSRKNRGAQKFLFSKQACITRSQLQALDFPTIRSRQMWSDSLLLASVSPMRCFQSRPAFGSTRARQTMACETAGGGTARGTARRATRWLSCEEESLVRSESPRNIFLLFRNRLTWKSCSSG